MDSDLKHWNARKNTHRRSECKYIKSKDPPKLVVIDQGIIYTSNEAARIILNSEIEI